MKKYVYLAGSFSDESNWRDNFKELLAKRFGEEISAFNPFERKIDENDVRVKIGHDLYCVKNCTILLVNAIGSTITLGTAHELLLAKHWNKPVIIVADDDAGIRFDQRVSKTGVVMKCYVHPFAANFADKIVETYEEALVWIGEVMDGTAELKSFEETLAPMGEYEKNVLPSDDITRKALEG